MSAVAIDRRDHFGMSSVTAKSKVPARLNINGAFNAMSIARSLRLGALNLIDEPMVLIDFSYLRPFPNERANANARATASSARIFYPRSKRCSTTSGCCSF